MRLLLDTHIFLWFISGDARLPGDWRDSIRDPDNEVYVSVVSLWEAIVKHHLGKLPVTTSTGGLSAGPTCTASDSELASG